MSEMVDHKIKIFIVDDHELVRQGLRMLINGEDDMQLCGEASTVKEALNMRKVLTPDVAIVDLSLPDGDGLDLIKKLHIWLPQMRIIVLSMHDDELFAERALQRGALGYINKQNSAQNLLKGIRQVLKNKIFVDPEVQKRLKQSSLLVNAPSTKKEKEKEKTPISRLTDRELQIYSAIGRGMSSKEISGLLNISVKTIETHRSHIKKKLSLASGTELVRSAIVCMLNKN